MTTQHIPVTGGCLCGAVRYEFEGVADPRLHLSLHDVPEELWRPLRPNPEVPGIGLQADEGRTQALCCQQVRQAMFLRRLRYARRILLRGNPDVWIYVGSLDRPEDWPMTKDASWGLSEHVYVDEKIPWYEIGDGLPQRTSASKTLLPAAQAYVDSLRP